MRAKLFKIFAAAVTLTAALMLAACTVTDPNKLIASHEKIIGTVNEMTITDVSTSFSANISIDKTAHGDINMSITGGKLECLRELKGQYLSLTYKMSGLTATSDYVPNSIDLEGLPNLVITLSFTLNNNVFTCKIGVDGIDLLIPAIRINGFTRTLFSEQLDNKSSETIRLFARQHYLGSPPPDGVIENGKYLYGLEGNEKINDVITRTTSTLLKADTGEFDGIKNFLDGLFDTHDIAEIANKIFSHRPITASADIKKGKFGVYMNELSANLDFTMTLGGRALTGIAGALDINDLFTHSSVLTADIRLSTLTKINPSA